MRPTDVGYASFLSGGIDSSFVCSVLKKNETSQTEAYTLRIGKDDEDFKRSQFVVDTLELKHQVIDID
jgi:asparagine synthetase B (glutamine-hydrolysing)